MSNDNNNKSGEITNYEALILQELKEIKGSINILVQEQEYIKKHLNNLEEKVEHHDIFMNAFLKDMNSVGRIAFEKLEVKDELVELQKLAYKLKKQKRPNTIDYILGFIALISGFIGAFLVEYFTSGKGH